MEILPRHNAFLDKYYEICKGFEVKEEMKEKQSITCECLWCRHAEYHYGFDAVDKTGGCLCRKGYDVRKVGEYPVKLREQEECGNE